MTGAEERDPNLIPWGWVILGLAAGLALVIGTIWLLWTFVGSVGVFLPLVGTIVMLALVAVFLVDLAGGGDAA